MKIMTSPQLEPIKISFSKAAQGHEFSSIHPELFHRDQNNKQRRMLIISGHARAKDTSCRLEKKLTYARFAISHLHPLMD
jgi:hypothetical protein